MQQTRRLPARHTSYAEQLRNSSPPLQYSVARHSVPERRKTSVEEKSYQVNVRCGVVLQVQLLGRQQITTSTLWVCRYPIPVATQNGVDCTCTCTGNLPHQAPVLFNRKNSTVSMHLMLGSVIIVISREMSVPNITVSGLALLLSLSPPSN